jgi:hypothetical protein
MYTTLFTTLSLSLALANACPARKKPSPITNTNTTIALQQTDNTNVTYLPVKPKAKATLLGDVIDRNLQRDSCGSVKWGSRALWTCRDTTFLSRQNLSSFAGFASSSASYTNFTNDLPSITPVNDDPFDFDHELVMYGDNKDSFYTLQKDECDGNAGGGCGDGTRFAIWPNVPPTVASEGSDGSIIAYTFIPNSHVTDKLGVVTRSPPTSLYRLDSAPTIDDTLPSVILVDEEFWALNEFAYGTYGTIAYNDYIYLYADSPSHDKALARVPYTSVENKSTYQYYVNNTWVNDKPIDNTVQAAFLNHPGAGGQGTYFYSEYLGCFVWIGQDWQSIVPDFYISTAPAPEGPWIEPYLLVSLPDGSAGFGGYTLQAHPGLVGDSKMNLMYVSYTKVDKHYSTPLYQLEFS